MGVGKKKTVRLDVVGETLRAPSIKLWRNSLPVIIISAFSKRTLAEKPCFFSIILIKLNIVMQYVLLFLEGIITFISPCLLPMLPIYISFFAAEQSVPSAGEHQGQVSLAGKRRAVINVLGFVLGFTIVFVILGAFAGTVGLLLVNHTTVVNIVTGLIVVFLGLNFIGIIKIGLFNRSGGITAKVKNLRFFSAMLFGIVFSITWTPCVGAFLGAALGKASMRGGIVSGIVMLLVYSLGLGIPFVVSAVLIDRLKVAFDFIKRHYRVINIVSGIVLVIMGVLMAAGLMGKFLSLV